MMNRKKLNFKRFVGLYIYASATSVKKNIYTKFPLEKISRQMPMLSLLIIVCIYIYIYIFFFRENVLNRLV